MDSISNNGSEPDVTIHWIIAGIVLQIPADTQIRTDRMGEAIHDQFDEQIALDHGDHVPVMEIVRHDSRKQKILAGSGPVSRREGIDTRGYTRRFCTVPPSCWGAQ